MASIRVILPCYLSNEFAGLKETILLLFETGAQLRLMVFDLFSGGGVNGFAGKMQMFENLAAET